MNQLVGQSASFTEVMRKVPQVALTDSSILLLGETGTGKELIARRIHLESSRAGRPFLPINCSALPETLIESELFGYVRGAFTGAISARKGLFEEADGNTIFLDEIGDMSLGAQAKLLRVLEDGEIRAVGSKEYKHVNIILISATNKDLEAAILSGRFREDLYYRINVITLHVPPLRERKEDIDELSNFFLNRYSARYGKKATGFSREALKILHLHHWPGNIRELENVIERAVVFSSGKIINTIDITLQQNDSARMESFKKAKETAIRKFERDYLQGLLLASRGNVSDASRMAKQDRRAFYRLLKRHGINIKSYKPAPHPEVSARH